ncbi:hypothetical protein QYF61_025042 [Mycteria americana]|uniref:Uncharacterized protein n=1 Tax=Mycteria americana TaxID=33587 RepID=A0AAN7RJQ9_MYCAM|nr:hypothetical protein QYF61_025042 [Mycteria americana]
MVQSCIRGGSDLTLGSTSLPRGWSNTATGFLERWSMPHTCQCPASQRSTYLVLYVALPLLSQFNGIQSNKTPVLRNSSIAELIENRKSRSELQTVNSFRGKSLVLCFVIPFARRILKLAVKRLPGQDITGSLVTQKCHLPLRKKPKPEDGCNNHQEKQHRNAGNEDRKMKLDYGRALFTTRNAGVRPPNAEDAEVSPGQG